MWIQYSVGTLFVLVGGVLRCTSSSRNSSSSFIISCIVNKISAYGDMAQAAHYVRVVLQMNSLTAACCVIRAEKEERGIITNFCSRPMRPFFFVVLIHIAMSTEGHLLVKTWYSMWCDRPCASTHAQLSSVVWIPARRISNSGDLLAVWVGVATLKRPD